VFNDLEYLLAFGLRENAFLSEGIAHDSKVFDLVVFGLCGEGVEERHVWFVALLRLLVLAEGQIVVALLLFLLCAFLRENPPVGHRVFNGLHVQTRPDAEFEGLHAAEARHSLESDFVVGDNFRNEQFFVVLVAGGQHRSQFV